MQIPYSHHHHYYSNTWLKCRKCLQMWEQNINKLAQGAENTTEDYCCSVRATVQGHLQIYMTYFEFNSSKLCVICCLDIDQVFINYVL